LLSEVQRDLQHTQQHLNNLRSKSVQTQDEVHSLKVGLADTNGNLDKVSKELSRVGNATSQLQVSDQETKERLIVLDEARRMADSRLDVLARDIQTGKDNDKRLQESIERQVNEDLRVLRKELANTNLMLNQINAEHKQTVEYARENRVGLRDARVDIEKAMTEVKKTNTVTNILENRLASTAKGLQQSWTKCAELTDGLVKLTECYDKTKARVEDNISLIKEVGTAAKRAQEHSDQVARQAEQNSDQLAAVCKSLDDEGSATEDMRHQINALKQGQATSARKLAAVQQELAEVEKTTSAVRAGLKEQSSLLLPNIHLDSAEAATSSARHGSLLMTGSSLASTASTARPTSRGQKAWS
jgi:chromosome segregation ATPase